MEQPRVGIVGAMVAELQTENAGLRHRIRSIELAIDGLNKKGFTPRPAEKEALERIKAHCRAALSE